MSKLLNSHVVGLPEIKNEQGRKFDKHVGFIYARGWQTTARGPHAARESILCGPQGSRTYIDSTYLNLC